MQFLLAYRSRVFGRRGRHVMNGRQHLGSFSVRTPAVINTIADLERLMKLPRAAKRLPAGGIPITIPGVDDRMRANFQSALRDYIRACGCGAGGAAFLVSLALLVGYVLAVAPESWLRLAVIVLTGLIGAIVLSGAAKLVALRIARARFEKSGARLIRSLETGGPDRIRANGGAS